MRLKPAEGFKARGHTGERRTCLARPIRREAWTESAGTCFIPKRTPPLHLRRNGRSGGALCVGLCLNGNGGGERGSTPLLSGIRPQNYSAWSEGVLCPLLTRQNRAVRRIERRRRTGPADDLVQIFLSQGLNILLFFGCFCLLFLIVHRRVFFSTEKDRMTNHSPAL